MDDKTKSFLNTIQKLKNDSKEKVLESWKLVCEMPLYGKFLYWFIMLLLFPFLLCWVLILLVKSISGIRINVSSSSDSYGFFTPAGMIFNNEEPSITLTKAGLKQPIEEIKVTISHEHVHYLQHLDVVSLQTKAYNKKITDGHLLFSEDDISDKTLGNYWFSEYEVEARLHELIVDYYRKFRCLPLDIKGFALLVFTSPGVFLANLEGSNHKAVLKWKNNKKSLKAITRFRSESITLDVNDMCCSKKNQEAGIRYVYEVLPIFYARLLRYYGDAEASQRFSDQISRPNFYDQLYGSTSAEKD